jgi:hypothetical protein
LTFGEFKHRGPIVLKGDETNQIREMLEESRTGLAFESLASPDLLEATTVAVKPALGRYLEMCNLSGPECWDADRNSVVWLIQLAQIAHMYTN